jgi:CDP-diacylglycerol--glycerol-3-phosphate 3-phosphatidyltransferase
LRIRSAIPVDRIGFSQYDSMMPIDAAQKESADPTRMTPAIQRFTDTLVEKTWLRLFPRSVRPNHVTVARFILVPLILVLLHYDLGWWGLGVFAAAIATDFIDGAMARTRDQITPLGTFIDPLADKLLVGAVLAWVGHEYLVVRIMLVFIALELALMVISAGILLRGRQVRPANAFGKIKMVVQSIALLSFLLSGILHIDSWVTVSVYLLWVALALAILSGSRQIGDVFQTQRR